MFCPRCGTEYRSGFTHCPDCDLDLEPFPAPDRSSGRELPNRSLRGVWEGEDQDECVSICERLRAAEIPFNVIQHRQQFLKGLDSKFKIVVPQDFHGKAREIIEEGHLDFADEGEDQRAMELPAEDGTPSAHEFDNDDREVSHQDAATVELWFEAAPRYCWMIESSLRENNIHARVEESDKGARKIFVTPHDESRAREIVREIKDATPPN